DGALLVLHVDDLLRADGLAPLLVDGVALVPAGTAQEPRVPAARDFLPGADRVDVLVELVAEEVVDLSRRRRRVHGRVAEDDQEGTRRRRRRDVRAHPLREEPVALGSVAAAALAEDRLQVLLEVEALRKARRLERPAVARAVADRR